MTNWRIIFFFKHRHYFSLIVLLQKRIFIESTFVLGTYYDIIIVSLAPNEKVGSNFVFQNIFFCAELLFFLLALFYRGVVTIK